MSALTGRYHIKEAISLLSEADHVQQHDYDLRFQDRQNLQRLKQRLMRAAAMLDATIDLKARVRDLLGRKRGDALEEAIAVELADFDAKAKHYRRCINDLQRRASDTMSMVWPTSSFPTPQHTSHWADTQPSYSTF